MISCSLLFANESALDSNSIFFFVKVEYTKTHSRETRQTWKYLHKRERESELLFGEKRRPISIIRVYIPPFISFPVKKYKGNDELTHACSPRRQSASERNSCG